MKDIKIFVNNQEIDIGDLKDLSLAITLAIADSNDINARKKAITKTVKFPATNNNKLIFGHPENYNSVVLLDQSTKPVIRIESDGTEIFIGYIKISSVTDLGGKIVEYVGNCIGTNGDWIQRIGNAKINELDYSSQNHINDWSTISTSEFANASIEYVYDLIDRGEFTGQLYTVNGVTKRGVNIQDRFPALRAYPMLQRIYKGIGYTLVSNFLSNTFFGKLYWMFTNDEMKHPDTFNATLLCQMQSNAIQNITPSLAVGAPVGIVKLNIGILTPYALSVNPSGAYAFNAPGRYFCLGRGRYTFKTTLTYLVSTFQFYDAAQTNKGEIIFTYKKINHLKEDVSYPAGSDASSQIYYVPVGGGTPSGSAIIERSFDLEYGDEIFMEAVMVFNQSQGNEFFRVTSMLFECTEVLGSLGMGENQYFDWAYNLPNTLQLDFISGLKAMFNLHFTTDVNTRTVYCEPRDDFYNEEAEDWSNFLDNDKNIGMDFLGSTLSKTMRYKYKNDSNDRFIEEWNKENGLVFGADDVGVNNAFAKDDIEDVENPLFAATWMEKCDRIGLSNGIIPRMWNEKTLPKKRTQKFLPRLLYYDGLKTLPTGEYWRFNMSGNLFYQALNTITMPFGGKKTKYPYFYSFNDSEVNDNNLMYDDRFYSSGLYQKHYRNAQKVLDDGRKFSMFFYLNDSQIQSMSFRKPKYIEKDGNGAYFILEKVSDYKSQDGVSTLCELIKVMGVQAIRTLRYQQGLPPIIYTSLGGDSLNVGNGVIATPIPIGTTRSGVAYFDGIEVVKVEDDIITPIYFIDENNQYHVVKVNPN